MSISLDELKAENEAGEINLESNQDMNEQDALDVENVEDDIETRSDDLSNTDIVDESEESEELEGWQQTDDDTSESDQSGFKPNAEAAKKRKQNKALRGTVKERDSEIELLRKEMAELKAGNATTAISSAPQLEPRPKIEDFDYDEERFQDASDDWHDKRIEQKFSSLSASTNQKQAQEQAQAKAMQDQQNSINDHYARAEKLVEQGKVSKDDYRNADTNVRRALESVFPNAGDKTADAIISTLNSLGEGSEKVMYQLGRNNNRLNEIIGVAQSDPSGLKLMAHLGKLHSDVQDPKKRRTNAPKPTSKLTGDAAASSNHGTLFKRWSKATHPQDRVDLKAKAKAAGEDVSSWKW